MDSIAQTQTPLGSFDAQELATYRAAYAHDLNHGSVEDQAELTDSVVIDFLPSGTFFYISAEVKA